jgi:hypothetical protein
MGEAQRPRSSKPARLARTALLALCSLGLAGAPARAAETGPAPERAPETAATTRSSEGPGPDSAPTTAAPPRPPTAPEPSAPAVIGPASAAPLPSARAPATHASPRPGTRPHVRRAPAVARHVAPARHHKPARAGRSRSFTAWPTASPLLSHRDGTLLLLLASIALGMLALSGLTLQRLLTRLGGLSHERPAP